MTRYAVNYSISFGIDVSQKEIDAMRKSLAKSDTDEMLWDMKINKDSSDQEIAEFIGIQNYRSAEEIELEKDETCIYEPEREFELDKYDEERKKELIEKNKPYRRRQMWNNLELDELKYLEVAITESKYLSYELKKELLNNIKHTIVRKTSLRENN